MKEGWEIKKLGELGKVSMCKRILKKQTTPIGDIPFYKIGTFGKIPNAFISKEIYEEYRSKYSFPKKGAILLSASGTIGRRVIYDGKPAYFQDSNIVWIDNDEKEVLNEYLYKFYGFCNWNPSRGATISRLYNDDLRRIEIPIPPLPEQKRIVAILDRAFALVEALEINAKQNLKNAKELFQSKLQAIFDNGKLKIENGEWEEKKFLDIVDYSKKPRGLKLESPIPFVPMNFVPLEEKYINFNEYRNRVSSGTFVKNGDLLLAKITPSFENGKQGILNIKEKYAYATTEVIPFQGKKEIIETTYLFYFLKSKVRKMLEKKMEGATGRQRLPHKVLNDVNVPFPKSLETQKQIVAQLDQLQAETKELEAIYQQKLDNLEEFKKSILQKAFNGELSKKEISV